MSAAGIVLAGAGGLIVGSFANVVVWRVPRRESIVSPGSRCPSCGRDIAWYDNIPVVSWLVLRGRCRHCKASIHVRYPLIELLTGVLFAVTAAVLERETDLIAFLPLMWVLVVLSFIDLEHKILPNRIVLPSIVTGAALLAVAAAVGPGWGDWLRAVEAGAVAFVVFFAIALVSPRGMGMGDVKLAALLGMALGYFEWPRVFIGLMAGFFFGALGGILLILSRRGGMKSQVPFGPYLALGTIIGILWGGPIVDAWLRR